MGVIGKYCKAYLLKDLQQYADWDVEFSGIQSSSDDSYPEGNLTDSLSEDTIVYLHDTYQVTRGIYPELNLIFKSDSEDWRKFCDKVLGFSIPDEVASGLNYQEEK